MKMAIMRKISKHIIRHLEADDILLTDWITQNLNTLSEITDNVVSEDEIFDELCDFNHTSYSKLIKELEKQISENQPMDRISLNQDADGIRVTISDFGKSIDCKLSKTIFEMFKKIENIKEMDKGIFYENFCSNFLEDIGMESSVTKASNDKGIDILAKYKTYLNKDWSHLVFDDYVYLLGQAKFYNTKIDTPILRRLVGDSIFLRFDQIDYIEVAHNAIHLVVFSHNGFYDAAIEFARKNKIMRMSTEQMVSVLCAQKKPLETKSVMYLLQFCNLLI